MLRAGEGDARSRLAAQNASTVPTSRQYGSVCGGFGMHDIENGWAEGLALGDRLRDDVLAEVVARRRVADVVLEDAVQVVGREHVDAHAAERTVRAGPASGRVGRLLDEARDESLLVDPITPNAVASSRGTSRQPTVTPLPPLTWSATMIE
jgi:hypothetical protein